jgi:hypothetical protein
MKKTQLDRLNAAKIVTEMRKAAPPERYAQGSGAVLDKREQRRLDRERGLVPFAVKLDGEIVRRVRALAEERKTGINEVVGELLAKALGSGR